MELTSETVESRVTAIIARNLKVEVSQVGRDTRLIEDLGADSLDALTIAMDVDREFGIKVDDSEISKFRTRGEIASAVTQHLEAQAIKSA
jgi:acyl carrier protein